MACARSEDSDQPGHPPSLIRVFAVRMKKAWVLSYPLSASEDSDQTGRMPRLMIRLGGCLGLSESSLGAQSFCWFCHGVAQIIRFQRIDNLSFHISARLESVRTQFPYVDFHSNKSQSNCTIQNNAQKMLGFNSTETAPFCWLLLSRHDSWVHTEQFPDWSVCVNRICTISFRKKQQQVCQMLTDLSFHTVISQTGRSLRDNPSFYRFFRT